MWWLLPKDYRHMALTPVHMTRTSSLIADHDPCVRGNYANTTNPYCSLLYSGTIVYTAVTDDVDTVGTIAYGITGKYTPIHLLIDVCCYVVK